MTAIAAVGLRRTFRPSAGAGRGTPPVVALDTVDLAVEDGSLVAVLGPSGCGKTTLLRTLAGMERPEAGSVHLSGEVLDGPGVHVPPERRSIGLVPQEGALFPHLDVQGNVAFGLRRLARADRRRRVIEMLDLVGLVDLAHRRPHELSGGQQQRVALARALAPDPKVVLLDEPFSALDTGLRAAIRDEVAALLRTSGTTALLVTHDQTEALTMADALAVMRAGRIVQMGSPAEIYRLPVDVWTAGFLGDAVLLPGRRDAPGDPDGLVDCALGRLQLASGFAHHQAEEVTVFFRPEQVQPAPPGGSGRSALMRSLRFQGPDAMVGLTVSGADLTARWPSGDLPAVGDEVNVQIRGEVLAYAPVL